MFLARGLLLLLRIGGTVGQWDLAHERHGELVQVLAATDRGVELLSQEKDEGRDGQADHDGDEVDHRALGAGGNDRAVGFFDHTGVVGRESLRQLVLLSFLEEVEVQRLLDLLLTFDREQVTGLAGVGGKTLVDLALGALQAGQLVVEGHQLVVDARDDGLTHGGEVVVEVDDEGVFLTAVGGEAVAPQHGRVVFPDLPFDGGAVDTRVGGQQLVLHRLVDEHVADIAGDGDLVVDLEDAVGGGGVLREVDVRHRIHVGQQVLALVGRDVLVDVAQLLLDEAETVVDEEGGAHHDLVLVLEPVVVVDRDQHVEEVVGAAFRDVVDGERHHVGVLGRELDAQLCGIGTCGTLDGPVRHVDVVLLIRLEVVGGHHAELTDGRVDGVAQVGRGFASHLFAVEDEAGEVCLVLADLHIEGQRSVVEGTHQVDFDG